MIVVGSASGVNGHHDSSHAMWEDTHARFCIDDHRCYSSGFSAGSVQALLMANEYSEHFAGVLTWAAGIPWCNPLVPKHIALWMMCGDADRGSLNIVKPAAQDLEAKEYSVKVKTFPGGHQQPPASLCREGVLWLDREVWPAQEKKLAEIAKEEPLPINSVVNAVYMTARCDRLITEKRYEEAIAQLELIQKGKFKERDLAPTSAYQLATAHAAMNHKDQALEWLEKAIAQGFKDVNAIGKNKNFDAIRNDDHFQAMLKKLPSPARKSTSRSTPHSNEAIASFHGDHPALQGSRLPYLRNLRVRADEASDI